MKKIGFKDFLTTNPGMEKDAQLAYRRMKRRKSQNYGNNNEDVPDKNYNDKSIKEAPLVASDMDMVDALWDEVRNKIIKDKLKKNFEKHLPFLQQLAKYGGFKITKKGQTKDKIFRYEIKK